MSKLYNENKKVYVSTNAIETSIHPKFKDFKPIILGLGIREKTAKKLITHFIVYWVGFFIWIYVSLTKIPMILLLGTIMWVTGCIAIWLLPDQEYDIARKTRVTIATYTLTLLGWRLVVYMLTATPIALWERALDITLPDSFTSAFLGFLTMAFVVTMFTTFIQYIGYIFQLFMFYKSRKKIGEKIKIYTKRGL